jgi:transposase-like protein
MINCKNCGSEKIVKRGLLKGKQRYLCRGCNKSFCFGDERRRHSRNNKIEAVKLLSGSVEPKSIEKIENIPSSTYTHPIRNLVKIIKSFFERNMKI